MIETAETREELDVRVRALDRVLRAMHIRVPLWVRPETWLAYYDFFATPRNCRQFSTGAPGIWWADMERYDTLKAAGTLR